MDVRSVSKSMLDAIQAIKDTKKPEIEKDTSVSTSVAAYAEQISKAQRKDEELFEVYELTEEMLDENAGNLKGLPSHMMKVVTHVGGGEHSEVTHARAKSHSNLRGLISNAVKNPNSVAVLHHNGVPIASLHTMYGGIHSRQGFGLHDDEKQRTVPKTHYPKHYGGTPYTSHSPVHKKGEAIDKMVYNIAGNKIGDDSMHDKETYKKHDFSVHIYHPDSARSALSDQRKDARIRQDTLKTYQAHAIDKLADKNVIGSSPKDHATTLHHELGKAIDSGDHAATREALGKLNQHLQYKSGLDTESDHKADYKRHLRDIRGDSWSKKYGRERIAAMKEKGYVKEDLFSEEELERLNDILDQFDGDEDFLVVNESENLEELSKKTLTSYVDKAALDVHNQAYNAGKYEGQGKGWDAKRLVKGIKRQSGIVKAAKKLAKEDKMDSYVDAIYEGKRGRPAKEGSAAWKRQQEAGASATEEPRQQIIQQLQRAKVSMSGGSKVKFRDGSEHHISGAHATKMIDKYMGLKPSEKLELQKRISTSHQNFMNEI